MFNVTTGAQIGKLTSPNTGPGSLFGSAVALDGTTALIGAPETSTIESPGQAFVFNILSGTQTRILQGSIW